MLEDRAVVESGGAPVWDNLDELAAQDLKYWIKSRRREQKSSNRNVWLQNLLPAKREGVDYTQDVVKSETDNDAFMLQSGNVHSEAKVSCSFQVLEKSSEKYRKPQIKNLQLKNRLKTVECGDPELFEWQQGEGHPPPAVRAASGMIFNIWTPPGGGNVGRRGGYYRSDMIYLFSPALRLHVRNHANESNLRVCCQD